MTDRRVSFPREKPEAGVAQVVVAWRDSKGRRMEFRGALPEASAHLLMRQAVDNQAAADRAKKAAE